MKPMAQETTPPSSPAEQAARRVMRQRRMRVWRSVLLFVGLTLIMLVLSMANRDKEAQRTCRRRMQFAAEMLQSVVDRGEPLPPHLPLPRERGARADRRERVAREHYHYGSLLQSVPADAKVLGVCVCVRPHHFFLNASGRHVLRLDVEKRRYSVGWETEAEYCRHAAQIGLPIKPPAPSTAPSAR